MYAVCVLLLLGVACDEEALAPPTVEPDDDAGGDAADVGRDVGGDVSGDVTTDGTPDAAEDVEVDPGPQLGVGELCQGNHVCASEICFFFEAGADVGVCTIYCGGDEECPMEWSCSRLVNAGSDAVNVCAPDNLCVDRDEDGHGLGPGCEGPDCDDEDPRVYPGNEEICDGIDNDCDGNVDNRVAEVGTACPTGMPGVCAEGAWFCTDDGELVCEPTVPPLREICDNLDNDCDGNVDEGDDDAPLVQTCYGGAPETLDTGTCVAGLRTCTAGRIGACEGQVLPVPEVCDGLDNDCDGDMDEGGPGEGLSCETGLDGICARGRTVCLGLEGVGCRAIEGEPEVCDNRDNDCDGDIDEDDEGEPLTVACYDGDRDLLGIGACAEGQRTCTEGAFGRCEDQVLPQEELCDTLDNDCDGEEDEGNPRGGFTCDTGALGVCGRGQTRCTDEGTQCIPDFVASEEVCDTLDNDCDGLTDEDDDELPLTQVCYDGPEDVMDTGVCMPGLQTCEEGQFGVCAGQVLPEVESCDTFDNDCDGDRDEGNPGGNVRCDTQELGVCAGGITECRDGDVICRQLAQASEEVCDGNDNDCDGAVDEDSEGDVLTRTCYDGRPGSERLGLCRLGSQTCGEGQFGVCVGQILPTVEVCDGFDNDCDDDEDEGNPGGNVQCDTEQDGVCAAGLTNCEQGQLLCRRQVDPSAERCDGFDNDCDGPVDEDEDGDALARDCYDGPDGTSDEGLCRMGRETCGEGQYGVCVNQVLPAAEVCDGFDNNCDGVPDDNNPEGNEVCDTGEDGICARGLTRCVEGELRCEPIFEVGDEVCDGLDNDCDGDVDEDTEGDALTRVCFDGDDDVMNTGACRPGRETCADGQFGACQGQILPVPEMCDNVDNDCDGSRDEGDPGGGVSCDTNEDGVCSAGISACSGGDVVCEQQVQSSDEVCDGLDNDCDGTRDDGFDGLGEPCQVGLGICRRAGISICDPDDNTADPVCDAEPGDANEVETCDFADDDCDGTVDEGFLNDGIYDTVPHCGGCDINCNNRWPGGPAQYNVVPICRVLQNRASCDFICREGAVDADELPDNGCELDPDEDGVYVTPLSAGGENHLDCGAYDDPCATIGYGITQAARLGRDRVRVSDGLFREAIALQGGIDVLGGHNRTNWLRDPEVNTTVVDGFVANPQGNDRVVVSATGISEATEFSGFTVTAPNAGPGGNSIGVYISDSTNALLLRDNIIQGGAGGNGSTGTRGSNGEPGQPGAPGLSSLIRTNCNLTRPGAVGGPRTCANPQGGDTDVYGGNGGESLCPVFEAMNGPGQPGLGLAPGLGGGAAYSFLSCNGGNSCCVDPDQPIEPSPGTPGDAGDDGDGGEGAGNGAVLNDGHWRGDAGGEGDFGFHGSGGGGGGTAAGVDAFATFGDYYYGAGGGAGGSGGCAATAGTGGFPGGGSFAIFMTFAAPPAINAMPQIADNRLRRGQGGAGGPGGNGGTGGELGTGGRGGAGLDEGDHDFCMFDGGLGGDGGRGGHGGGGGGGAGGASYDILVFGAAATPNYDNDYEVPDGDETGGLGGSGGNSDNTETGEGQPGQPGDSGNLEVLP
jgi:hypothetical protein